MRKRVPWLLLLVTVMVVALSACAEPTPAAVPAGEDVHEVKFKIDDNDIQCRSDDPEYFGLTAFDEDKSTPYTLTVKKGTTLSIIPDISSSRSTMPHNITIEGTDIDCDLEPGGDPQGPFLVTFNEVGKFRVYCKFHPDKMPHDDAYIEVVE